MTTLVLVGRCADKRNVSQILINGRTLVNIKIHDIPEAVFEIVADTVGRIDPDRIEIVGGGSINRSYRLTTLRGTIYVLKTNTQSALGMFEAEREGLETLRDADAIRVPEPIQVSAGGGTCHSCCWSILNSAIRRQRLPQRRAAMLWRMLHQTGQTALRLASRKYDRQYSAGEWLVGGLGRVFT